MYIPSLLFGGKNDCLTVSGTTASGSFQSGSEIWDYYKFANVGSASFQVLEGVTVNAKIFMVAGGGGGGVSFDNSIGGLSAGGGGAGGVVYTSATLGPGTYPLYVGDGGAGSQVGEESWINIDPLLIPASYLSYFTSGSRLTAEGGGNGAWFTSLANGYGSSAAGYPATGGGSGGGGIQALRWASNNGPGGNVLMIEGGGRNPQGNDGGVPNGPNCDSGGTFYTTATGGGGVKGASDDTDCVFAVGYQTPGGEGDFYNVDGTPKQYAYGGASMRGNVWEAAPYDSASAVYRAAGAGGWGTSDLYPVTLDKELGRKGEIVLLVPVCQLDLTECIEYTVFGGTSGGNITYVPCGESEFTSSVVAGGTTQTICSYPISNPSTFPSASGDVNYVTNGACDSFIPPTPTPTPDVPFDCRTITFTAGSSGGTSSHYECGVSQSSYDTPGSGSVLTSLAPNEVFSPCMVSGSYHSITGFGSTQSISGVCTSSIIIVDPCDCKTISFTAGSGGGTAIYYPCGVSETSYDTAAYATSTAVAANQTLAVCTVSGSYKAITGGGASISIGGTCTSSLPLCNP